MNVADLITVFSQLQIQELKRSLHRSHLAIKQTPRRPGHPLVKPPLTKSNRGRKKMSFWPKPRASGKRTVRTLLTSIKRTPCYCVDAPPPPPPAAPLDHLHRTCRHISNSTWICIQQKPIKPSQKRLRPVPVSYSNIIDLFTHLFLISSHS